MINYEVFVGNTSYTALIKQEIQQLTLCMNHQGVSAGNLVAIAIHEPISWLVAYYACKELEAVPVVIGKVAELDKQLEIVRADYVCYTSDHYKIQIESLSVVKERNIPSNTGLICRTSGSTVGMPKYVAWSKEGITYQKQETTRVFGYKEGERLLFTLPLWGAYGLSIVGVLEHNSMDLVIPANLRPRSIITVLEKQNVCWVESAPFFYQTMLPYLFKEQRGIEEIGVKGWGCGGDLLTHTFVQQWVKMTGVPILDGYGLTEAGPNVSLNRPYDYCYGTVGKPLSGTEINFSEDRELWVRSPSVMLGYYANGQVDASMLHNGWLSTGDMATRDEHGYVTILGRKKNIIIVNGYNVSPEYVERTIREHYGIRDVAVVGVPHPTRGNRLCAFVVGDASLTKRDIDLFIKDKVDEPSRPSFYEIIPHLPVLANGKTDRNQLKGIAEVRFGQESFV
ncbi:class I adenylate-forming enzyme family protein [Brevibacillus halotolerans]|uniref:class I adenylate-forming enzyme family protein n=1 Tax=Brevibacillus halotolerans TaxID=1507437 RepID=UPI0015EE7EFF|nr:fatty acid--CoA ligase family protein [Brevibacillus halotolerans]MBA4533243.1 long-chain fatty acid--CoA ligase [Brevibacillus halotolerans]